MNKDDFLEKGNKIQRMIYLAIELIVPFIVVGFIIYYVTKSGYLESFGSSTAYIFIGVALVVLVSYIIRFIFDLRRDKKGQLLNSTLKYAEKALTTRADRKSPKKSEKPSIDDIREKYRK